MDTVRFAKLVKQACNRTPAHKRAGDRAWIHRAWTHGDFYDRHGMDYLDFKAWLWLAHVAGLVELSRCDMVEAFDPTDVRRSELTYKGATFNFIRID